MDIFLLTDIIGIIAFSLSGFLVGLRNRLDLLGIVIASSLTALGGGILRDALLHRTPFAFSEYYPATTLVATIIIAFAFQSLRSEKIEHRWLYTEFSYGSRRRGNARCHDQSGPRRTGQ